MPEGVSLKDSKVEQAADVAVQPRLPSRFNWCRRQQIFFLEEQLAPLLYILDTLSHYH